MRPPSSDRLKEAWVLCFILGIIMLNYPFLEIFNKPVELFDIPLLIWYLMIGWLFSIFVIYLFTRHIGKQAQQSDSSHEELE